MFNFLKRKKRVRARIISTEEFNKEIITGKKDALITFSAAWCGACKMQKPLIHDLADAHQDKNICIGFVDVDTETQLSQLFNIKGIPTTIAFHNGEIFFRHSGLLSRKNLESIIQQLEKTS